MVASLTEQEKQIDVVPRNPADPPDRPGEEE